MGNAIAALSFHVTHVNPKAKTNAKRSEEELVMPQQNHNINSLNGNSSDYDMCKAQTLADVTCDFNDTFKMEENFESLWQQSTKGEHKDKDEFSEEVNKTFDDKKGMSNMHNNAFQRKD